MKPLKTYDEIEAEIEQRFHQNRVRKQALTSLVLEAAENGGLLVSRPPKKLWNYSIVEVQGECSVLEERGRLTLLRDGRYVVTGDRGVGGIGGKKA